MSLKYCNIQTDFSWDVINADTSNQLENAFKQLIEISLNAIFTASTAASDDELCIEFIRLLTELMMYLEDSIKQRFSAVRLTKRPSVIALDYVVAALKREMHRLEVENPSMKEVEEPVINNDRITEMRNQAHAALGYDDTSRAADYYRQIANLRPSDWEAVFYKEFCPAFNTPEMVSTISIQENTKKITKAMAQAMPLAKKQILIRSELLADLSLVCTWTTKAATNYFLATMNEYKSSLQNKTDNTRKAEQVYWIIQMLFTCGDIVEQNFGFDFELCHNLCSVYWKIAFDCYENCNMNVPSNMCEYYHKMLKYEPSFRCSKPLTDSNKGSRTDGCYVATAVYGSYDCPQVWILRRFRDFSLKQSLIGRLFVHVYYAVSPTLVRLFGKTKWFNKGCRVILDQFVAKLQIEGYDYTPYTDCIEIK